MRVIMDGDISVKGLIRETRKEEHLTQKQLAEMLNMSAGTIQQYESGRRSITVDTLIDIMDVMGYDLLVTKMKKGVMTY